MIGMRPACCSTTNPAASSAMLPAIPNVLTAVKACRGNVNGSNFNTCAAPAAADPMNSAGSEVRASCHTGIAVFERSTAVYPESGTPSSPASREVNGSPNTAAAPAHGGATASIHDPNAHRRAQPQHAQHREKSLRPPEVRDQQGRCRCRRRRTPPSDTCVPTAADPRRRSAGSPRPTPAQLPRRRRRRSTAAQSRSRPVP